MALKATSKPLISVLCPYDLKPSMTMHLMYIAAAAAAVAKENSDDEMEKSAPDPDPSLSAVASLSSVVFFPFFTLYFLLFSL
jgi:hypothetical protein